MKITTDIMSQDGRRTEADIMNKHALASGDRDRALEKLRKALEGTA
jgi:hypothetical protein